MISPRYQPFPGQEGPAWCTNVAPYDADPAGIINGLLFPYNTSPSIYHCPADLSTIQAHDGTNLVPPRLRSYSMSQSVNGLVYAGQLAEYIPHSANSRR